MRYFFDIHLNGQCQLDERGQDFRSLEDARNYVITCGRICLTDGLPRERSVLAQCIIEITDRESLSDVVMLADVIRPHRNPRRVLQRAANAFGIGDLRRWLGEALAASMAADILDVPQFVPKP